MTNRHAHLLDPDQVQRAIVVHTILENYRTILTNPTKFPRCRELLKEWQAFSHDVKKEALREIKDPKPDRSSKKQAEKPPEEMNYAEGVKEDNHDPCS